MAVLVDPAVFLTDPRCYANELQFQEQLTALRQTHPVSWVQARGHPPFWAVLRHADITAVLGDSDLFINRPRFRLYPNDVEGMLESLFAVGAAPHLLQRDGDQHRRLRSVGAEWFRPRRMREFHTQIDELAQRNVNRMDDIGPECDFVSEVATRYPLEALMLLLGLPPEDFDLIQSLTQEIFGSDEPEYRRGRTVADLQHVFADLSKYFYRVAKQRRADPTDDLASAIANARIDGEYLPDNEINSFFFIIATAGHDTTRHAISGGLRALADHPVQLSKLRGQPYIPSTAVEEMVRWSVPAKESMRTATADTELGGTTIYEGQSVYLSLVAGNHDPDVFEDPFNFDVTRTPNKHLSFGHGSHFCMGAPLARMYIESFFNALLPRLDHIELSGPPESMATIFVGGLKHLPIRYRLRN